MCAYRRLWGWDLERWVVGSGVVAGGLGVAQSSPGQSVGSGHLGSCHTAHCPSFQLFTRYIIISEIPSEMEVAPRYRFICTAYTAFTAHTVFEQRGYYAYIYNVVLWLYGLWSKKGDWVTGDPCSKCLA